MISETELRLGNIVNDEFTTIVGIHGDDHVMIHRVPHHPNGEKVIRVSTGELTPLLLNEHLLQSMHFAKDANADFFSKISPDGNSIAVRPGPITYVYVYRGDYEHRNRISQQENMPVHYFQNLYFVLTGVECTLHIMV